MSPAPFGLSMIPARAGLSRAPGFLSLPCFESLSLLPAVGLSPTQHTLPGDWRERCFMALALQLSISFLKMSCTGVFLKKSFLKSFVRLA